ncbi:MAG: hypothetical protein LBG43_10740 [Treponema sp.]|jgi:hypothetical protein|nr:hypothetical protein [Treponema sp.]
MFLDEYSAADTLAEIAAIDAAIAKAWARLEAAISANEEFRQNCELRRKAPPDWMIGVNTAFKKGRFDIAKNALAKGLSVDFIQDLTGLKIEDIIALQNEK